MEREGESDDDETCNLPLVRDAEAPHYVSGYTTEPTDRMCGAEDAIPRMRRERGQALSVMQN